MVDHSCPMLLRHNRNRFWPFTVELIDLNWIRSPKSLKNYFWAIFGRFGVSNRWHNGWPMVDQSCPMLLHHNRNHFWPFTVKLNDSNWIRGPKSTFWVIIRCQRWPVGTVFGHYRRNMKSRDTPAVYKTITAFLLSYFIIIQNIENSQAVLEILNFEKSSDVIGRERLAQKRGEGIFFWKFCFGQFLPLIAP